MNELNECIKRIQGNELKGSEWNKLNELNIMNEMKCMNEMYEPNEIKIK